MPQRQKKGRRQKKNNTKMESATWFCWLKKTTHIKTIHIMFVCHQKVPNKTFPFDCKWKEHTFQHPFTFDKWISSR